MLSDNDREALATATVTAIGVTCAVFGILGTLHYGWVRTMALCGTAVLFFAVGCLMAHFAVRPLRRRTTPARRTPEPATTTDDDTEE